MKRSNRNSSGKIVNIYSSSHVNVAMRSRSRAPVYEILSRARKGSVREKKLNCHHINEIFRMISASANSSHSFERTHIEHQIPTPLQPTNRRQSVMEQKTHTPAKFRWKKKHCEIITFKYKCHNISFRWSWTRDATAAASFKHICSECRNGMLNASEWQSGWKCRNGNGLKQRTATKLMIATL